MHSMRLGLQVGTGCVYVTLQDRQGREGCMMQTKKEGKSVCIVEGLGGGSVYVLLAQETDRKIKL